MRQVASRTYPSPALRPRMRLKSGKCGRVEMVGVGRERRPSPSPGESLRSAAAPQQDQRYEAADHQRQGYRYG